MMLHDSPLAVLRRLMIWCSSSLKELAALEIFSSSADICRAFEDMPDQVRDAGYSAADLMAAGLGSIGLGL